MAFDWGSIRQSFVASVTQVTPVDHEVSECSSDFADLSLEEEGLMSLVIEFRTPQNPKARSAGIAANRCFPTIAQPTGATDFSGGTTARLNRKNPREPPDPPFPEAIRPTRFRDPPIAALHFGITGKRLVN